ncbi:hypothetical protein [Enterovibrio norvegicus]|uniref:hypothetical protein n=1 Tax=Enterovibrio norvegicus TaxID=188144 RepID=UPI00352FCB1E
MIRCEAYYPSPDDSTAQAEMVGDTAPTDWDVQVNTSGSTVTYTVGPDATAQPTPAEFTDYFESRLPGAEIRDISDANFNPGNQNNPNANLDNPDDDNGDNNDNNNGDFDPAEQQEMV